MSYKVKNLALLLLPCLLLSNIKSAEAQGVVSLSEEAMFDDELETTKNFPTAAPVDEPQPQAQEQAQPPVVPSVPQRAEPQEEADDIMPNLAITAKKTDSSSKQTNFENKDNSSKTTTKVDDLFSQMSDIERSTALLNLELRRERLQNEIEAVKNQRRQALEQEKIKAEELKQKQLEKENEETRKRNLEMQRLRELDIEFEKLRQEKILKAYKNQMLEETQKWIAHDAMFYKTIADLRQEKKLLSDKYKEKMVALKNEADNAYKAYKAKLESHSNEVQNLNSQIDVLRGRIASLEEEVAERSRNPFASGADQMMSTLPSTTPTTSSDDIGGDKIAKVEPVSGKLAKYYAVTEIRGQGGELIAKLINKNGLSFYVKKGTALQSGHIVSEITSTYVAADRNYKKDYIYFSAGGILPEETDAFEVEKEEKEEE